VHTPHTHTILHTHARPFCLGLTVYTRFTRLHTTHLRRTRTLPHTHTYMPAHHAARLDTYGYAVLYWILPFTRFTRLRLHGCGLFGSPLVGSRLVYHVASRFGLRTRSRQFTHNTRVFDLHCLPHCPRVLYHCTVLGWLVHICGCAVYRLRGYVTAHTRYLCRVWFTRLALAAAQLGLPFCRLLRLRFYAFTLLPARSCLVGSVWFTTFGSYTHTFGSFTFARFFTVHTHTLHTTFWITFATHAVHTAHRFDYRTLFWFCRVGFPHTRFLFPCHGWFLYAVFPRWVLAH